MAPKKGSKRRVRGQAALDLRPGERRRLAKLSEDPDYLAVKESLGEPLSALERETLRAWREAPKGGVQ
jgi:hypothetical protein